MISETAFRELLRKWRHARLNHDQGELDYPSINILHPEHGISGEVSEHDPDVELFQRVVEYLSPELRAVFEAYHLAIIRGCSCKGTPHKLRSAMLRMDPQAYRMREQSAAEIIRRELLTFLEKRVVSIPV